MYHRASLSRIEDHLTIERPSTCFQVNPPQDDPYLIYQPDLDPRTSLHQPSSIHLPLHPTNSYVSPCDMFLSNPMIQGLYKNFQENQGYQLDPIDREPSPQPIVDTLHSREHPYDGETSNGHIEDIPLSRDSRSPPIHSSA